GRLDGAIRLVEQGHVGHWLHLGGALDGYRASFAFGLDRGDGGAGATVFGGPLAALAVLAVLQGLLGLQGQRLAITLIEVGADGLTQVATGQGTGNHCGSTTTAIANLAAYQNACGYAYQGADVFLVHPLVVGHVGATGGEGNGA